MWSLKAALDSREKVYLISLENEMKTAYDIRLFCSQAVERGRVKVRKQQKKGEG
jgi:hypothetical protein